MDGSWFWQALGWLALALNVWGNLALTATDASRLAAARAEGHAEGYREGINRKDEISPADAYKKPYDQLVAKVRAFEEASGVEIGGWNLGRVVSTVRLLSGGWDAPIDALEGCPPVTGGWRGSDQGLRWRVREAARAGHGHRATVLLLGLR